MKAFQPVDRILICGFFALGILFHVMGIGQPFLGNFAQHQTDYATVIQRWLANDSIEPLNPIMRFMGSGQNRMFFGDFPLNIIAVTGFVKLTHLPIEVAGRGLSAIFFFLSFIAFIKITQRLNLPSGPRQLAALFYLFSPLTVIYGQSFLLEISAVSWGLWGAYFFLRWLAAPKLKDLALCALLNSLMLATRIYFMPILGLYAIVAFFYLKNIKQFITLGIFFLFTSLIIPFGWQAFAAQAAKAYADQSSLSDNLKVFSALSNPTFLKSILSRDFVLTFVATLINKLCNPIGFFLALFAFVFSGTFKNLKRITCVYFLCFLPLIILAPRKYIEFEYYYLPFVPLVSLWAGIGLDKLWSHPRFGSMPYKWLTLCLVIVFSARFFIRPVFTAPDEDRHVIEAARDVESLTKSHDRVIAAHGSSTSFLYYTNRDGWPFELPDIIRGVRNLADNKGSAIERLERFRSQGATVFALSSKSNKQINPVFFQYLDINYSVLKETDDWIIYSLGSKK